DFSSKKIKYYVSEAGNPSDFITASFEHTFSNVGVIYLGFGVGAMGIDDIEIDEADIFRNVSSSVSDGARGVGINPAFEFEFSSSLDENSIPVADINGDSSYIDEITVIGNKMLITLNTTLDYNTTYTLNIQGIKSLFGDEISKSVIFTTGSESECLASVDSSGKKVKVSFRLPGSSENKKINSYRKNETDLTQIPFNLMIAKSGESTPILTYTDFVNSTMSFEKSFSMPKECESGMYEVSVKTDETVKNSAPFRYINPASASRAFEELNSGKKLSEVVAEHYASLAMTAEEAAAVSEDCEKYFEQYTLGASIGLAEFTNAYANASLKAILTSDESDESKLDAIYNTHLATGVDYESFASRSEAERQYCYNALKEGYNKADTLNEEIKLNLIAYEINASAEYTWEKYEELILGKYSDVIKADTTEYENLKYKSKVINKIKNSTYNELSDIASAFETAVSDQAYEEEYDDSSNNSSGNSGGGGGFGGGGSGAGTGPVLDVNIGNDYIAPTPEQTKNFA
ncbi:MAG: Ig-like domain-containing protein, partial [Clostridia bacterium]|nr:Ig-like domain-containing protein [Clostridia bacterium]